MSMTEFGSSSQDLEAMGHYLGESHQNVLYDLSVAKAPPPDALEAVDHYLGVSTESVLDDLAIAKYTRLYPHQHISKLQILV